MKQKLFIAVLLLLSTTLFGQGRIIIQDPPAVIDRGQIVLKHVNAKIDLTDGAGMVTLEQVFFNPSSQRLEGNYLFPIPKHAQLSDFYLYINGQKTKGQLLDANQAKRTYEQIVRSMRDPALLEYVGHNLFKARIFPIEPKSERKIELSYAQAIQMDQNMFRFNLPLRSTGQASIPSFDLTMNLESKNGLGNIYSPSHHIEIKREGKNRVRITLNQENISADKDLILYYSYAAKEINSSLLSFRPRTDQDGFFMFMASPEFSQKKNQKIASDYIFVLDISGSMQGEKIKQARKALEFCLNTLEPVDRFNIIAFSSGINSFKQELIDASEDNIKNARYFVSNLDANGGTNINEALLNGLALKKKSDKKPGSIIFLTDGLPTEGEQDISHILQNVQSARTNNIRIFSFGVGYDVNTFLLDKLSADGRGSANYVKPGEDIERQVSALFAKISAPVLSDPEIHFGQSEVYDIYPQKLPDLFKGQSLMVIGRYRNPGRAGIKLNGKQNGVQRKFGYSHHFNKHNSENEFIAKLWANRKVAHLMMQIRFEGEKKEWIESVKTLGKTYGIVTPYTSYLVTEQTQELVLAQSDPSANTARRLQAKKQAQDRISQEDEEAVGSVTFMKSLSAKPKSAATSSGKSAVMSSRIMKRFETSDKNDDMLLTFKRVGAKTFYLQEGMWQEQKISESKTNDIKIEFASPAYFELSQKNPDVRSILSLGEKIRFEWKGQIYQIN